MNKLQLFQIIKGSMKSKISFQTIDSAAFILAGCSLNHKQVAKYQTVKKIVKPATDR